MPNNAQKTPRRIPVTRDGGSATANTESLEKLFGAAKAPQRLDRVRHRRIRPVWWIVGSLALLAVAAVVGFFVFGAKQFSGDLVKVTIDTATEAASGDIITVTINYTNGESVSLGNASLVTRFPDGFTVRQTSAEPQNSNGNSWDLGTLTPGEKGSLTISGQLDGEVGSAKTFTAKLVYKPSDFNATFETEGTITVTITESIIVLKLEGPTRVAPGATVDYTLSYTSTSEGVLENLTIQPEWPSDFATGTIEPALNENKVWTIPRLTKSEGGSVKFSGSFTGDVGDSAQFSFIVSRTTADGFSEKQLTYQPLVLLVGGELTVKLLVNDSEEATSIDHGGTLVYKLNYTNTTEFELKNVSFSLQLEEAVLSYSDLVMTPTGRREEKKITWDSQTTPALALLKPEATGTLEVSVPIRSNLTIDTDKDVNFSIIATVNGSVGEVVDGGGLTITIPTITRENKVASVLSIGAEARYYAEDGTTLGSGLLPPAVGQATSYRVFITLQNNTNDITGMTVTTTLPDGVTWSANQAVSAGTLTYNDTNKTVTWSINQLPAGTGYYNPSLTAQFSLTLTPTSAMVGTAPTLTGTITAHGTDNYTQTERTSTASGLTTELANDAVAAASAVVVE